MAGKPKILIVDDKPENLYAMDKVLQKLAVEIVPAPSGALALQLALEHEFFAAIVDVQMPEMDGYELVELLRGNEATESLPVIFVSAIYSDEYHHRKGYEAGAVDFMSKPFAPEILLSKVKVFLDLYQQRIRLQEVVNDLDKAGMALARRALQMETSNQVGRTVTALLDLDDLLSQVAGLIQTSFNYYYVGIWLRDEVRLATILRACSHRASRACFAAGFDIPFDDPPSIITHVCRSGQSYLSKDVRASEIQPDIAHLPDTRSEMVLPLQVGSSTLGALDIQSERVDAFDRQDITVIHTLADQIAIAIRNAQLYAQLMRFNQGLEDLVSQRTAELDKAYKQLELLDKNKTTFVAVAAHELRTPLTLIKGYIQLLDSRVETQPETQEIIRGIISGQNRMDEVINSLLDMALITSNTLEVCQEPLSLLAVIVRIVSGFNSALQERRLTLTLVDMERLPDIEADPDLMQKLFYHLIVNAIKYTPDSKTITVCGQTLSEKDAPTSVEIVVSDTGVGIAPEHHDLIFKKFYQTERAMFHSSGKTKFKGGGPGLGLAIAKGIVEAHGGRIWVESPGHNEITCPGSQFHVVLPIKQPQVQLPQE